jgi:hypothetical protein
VSLPLGRRHWALVIAVIVAIALVVTLIISTTLLRATLSSHAAATTSYVGATAGANTGCASPGFTSVQSAVDATPSGGIVYVCAVGSPYAAPVSINKSLTLTGDAGATIKAPSGPFPAFASLPPQFAADNLFTPEAIVLVWGSGVSVNISKIALVGTFDVSGCAAQVFGLLALAGANVKVDSLSVSGIRATNSSLWGCQNGVGIQIGREYWPNQAFNFLVEDFVGTGTVKNSSVSDYQKNGITIDGPGSRADVRGNTVTGDGRVAYIAQNGIQVSRGASGQIRDNTVSGDAYTGTGCASSGGILIYGGGGDPLVTGAQIMRNTISNTDVGIYVNNFNDDFSGPPATQTNIKADGNTISTSALTNVGNCGPGFPFVGYSVGINEIGNNDKVINNTITGYAPESTTPGGPYVQAIDTSSFLTIAAKVHANHV